MQVNSLSLTYDMSDIIIVTCIIVIIKGYEYKLCTDWRGLIMLIDTFTLFTRLQY